MTEKSKRLHVSKLEAIAQAATQAALQNALSEGKIWITAEQEKDLTLGTFIQDDKCTFELYISKEKHNEALTVSRVTIDRYSGEIIGLVEVYLPPVLTIQLPPR